ncbi:hypothetical protein [Bacteroides oleiciplenus]|uniref:hypothetical protein n=1 Tax=Bacteroides oleiciplenus TaxID=626931 RepID=UPI0015F347A3|nr:hypothetical protein [Bacteroides oleiciplenus]
MHTTSRDYRMVGDRDFGHLVSAKEQRVFTFTRKGIDKTFSYQVADAITTILQVNKNNHLPRVHGSVAGG